MYGAEVKYEGPGAYSSTRACPNVYEYIELAKLT